jgi:hypothetical protein
MSSDIYRAHLTSIVLKSAANKLRREKSNMLVSWNSRMETYLCWCYVVYRSELAINWAIDPIFEIWFVIIKFV